MTNFRAFTPEDSVTVASAALSQVSNEPVVITAVRNLGHDTRRNLILRAHALQSGIEPRPIIIKATRAAAYDADATSVYEISGFAKEWAAANYLARHRSGHWFAPKLLAHDLKRGVLVYDDLGDGLTSLVEPLLNGTRPDAENALTAYAKALGALHSATIGCREEFSAIVREGFPAAFIPPPAHLWIDNVARVPHALLGGEFPESEANCILERLREPGRWQALVHGDPCPDNVLLPEDGRAVLIDFEFSRPSHALLDAAYWRMGFPTCWCAGTIPHEISRRIDRAYREAIADAIPDALDDEKFRRESAVIDVAWLLGNLAWLLKGALSNDDVWGRATNRSRIILYLGRVIRSVEEADILPGMRTLALTWLRDLRGRWPETIALSHFPAFALPPT
jgi:hypothetical protein